MKIYVSGEITLFPFKGSFMIPYDVDFKVDLKLFTIKSGMVTDLGSVPVPFRNMVSRFGKGTVPYILHDFGYKYQPENTNRKFWDKVLLQSLKDHKMVWWKRRIIYITLRSFGWFVWANNKRYIYEQI